MQPTVEAELAGVQRVLELWAADDTLPTELVTDLQAVAKTLERLSRNWSRVLPYLVADNAATADLLRAVRPQVPSDVAESIDRAIAPCEPAPDPAAFDVAVAHERHEQLRGVLSQVIAVHPPGRDGGSGVSESVRAQVVARLRQSVNERPW